jgi:hypothetical protein
MAVTCDLNLASFSGNSIDIFPARHMQTLLLHEDLCGSVLDSREYSNVSLVQGYRGDIFVLQILVRSTLAYKISWCI